VKKSILDLDENIVAAFSYLFGPISGIIVLVLEKDNKFVRFHALQSTLWFLLLMIIGWIVGIIGDIFAIVPLVGGIFGGIFGLVAGIFGLIGLISMIWLIIKAFMQETWKIPVLGDVAWNQVNK